MNDTSPGVTPAVRLVQQLLGESTDLDALAWQPFHPGVEIVYLSIGPDYGAASALLRYAPGARVPRHRHPGYEHVFILRGAQSDEHGVYPQGMIVINPPGSVHSVWSDTGCVALLIWEKTPVILD